MQLLADVALGVVAVVLITRFGSASLDRAIAAFAALIGGWRSDSWPRGVQEEDRDRPWGRGAAPQPYREPLLPTPILMRVQGQVRRP